MHGDVELAVLGEWDSLGETALMGEDDDEEFCRTASCTAISAVEALVLSKLVFNGMRREHEDAGSGLATAASKRIEMLTEQDETRRAAAKQEEEDGGGAPAPLERDMIIEVLEDGWEDETEEGVI